MISARAILYLMAIGVAIVLLLAGCHSGTTHSDGGVNVQQVDAPPSGKCIVVNRNDTGSLGVWCK